MISYSFHPEAEAELEDASLFYESRMLGLGKSFAAEVERTIALIREFPDAGSPAVLPRRRFWSRVCIRGPCNGEASMSPNPATHRTRGTRRALQVSSAAPRWFPR